MLQQKLTIVPVTLQPDNKISFSSPAPTKTHIGCTIKAANLEISLFIGVDEYVIQVVMRELKRLEV